MRPAGLCSQRGRQSGRDGPLPGSTAQLTSSHPAASPRERLLPLIAPGAPTAPSGRPESRQPA